MSVIALRNVLSQQMVLSDDQKETLKEDSEFQDMAIGMLLLKLDESQLRSVEQLPDALESIGLLHSEMALLFALGAMDELRSQGFIPKEETEESINHFFETWARQPITSLLPAKTILMDGGEATFTSIVLGLELKLVVPINLVSLFVAESLLGSIEAFFATSINQRIIPFCETATIRVVPVEAKAGFAVKLKEGADDPEFEFFHPPSLERTEKGRKQFLDALQETIIRLMTHVAIIDSPKRYIETVAGEELGFRRALNFSEIDILTSNVFGDEPRFTIERWMQDAGLRAYTYARAQAWQPTPVAAPQKDEKPASYGKGEIPEELRNSFENATHRQRRVLSMINLPLWNRAKWRGTIYVQGPFDPPILMGIGFRDADAGRKIFEGWRKRLGDVDEKERLRITIITGVKKKHPSHYNVVIGTNLHPDDRNAGDVVIAVSRINGMTPDTTENLDRFLAGYRESGKYVIAPVHFKGEHVEPDIFTDLIIEKAELIVREAWEIGEHDPDGMGITEDDDPVIPPGITDPPIAKLLKQKARIKSRRPGP